MNQDFESPDFFAEDVSAGFDSVLDSDFFSDVDSGVVVLTGEEEDFPSPDFL